MTEQDPSFRWDDVRVDMSTYRIQGATGEWAVVIGLEDHAQVACNATRSSGGPD